MFDHVNMCTYDPIRANEILRENKYKFKVVVDRETGEELKSFARYGDMKIIVYPQGRIIITGSLHKFSNFLLTGKSFNSNSFTISGLLNVSKFITDNLKLNIGALEVHSIEFGFNLQLKYSPLVVLKNIKYFKDHQFFQKKFDSPGALLECCLSEYDIKFYDKGTQVQNPQDIIRIEKRIKRMRVAFTTKTYFSNLLDRSTWETCMANFLETLKLIVFTDQFKTSDLPLTSKKYIKMLNSSDEWLEITKQKRSIAKFQVEKIISNYGKLKLKDMLIPLLKVEFENNLRM